MKAAGRNDPPGKGYHPQRDTASRQTPTPRSAKGWSVRFTRHIMSLSPLFWIGALVAVISGCADSDPPQPIEETFEAALIDTSTDFSHLRYANGEISLNDRCPIRRNKLNPKVRPLFVNGRPMGFC